MSSYRGVKITIVNKNGNGNEEEKDLNTTESEDTAKKVSKLQKASIASLVNRGVGILTDTAEFALNTNLTLTDNYKMQNNMSIAKSIISKASSTVTSAIGAGMVLGPVGVAVSLALSATSLGVDIAKNYYNQAISIKQAENQIDYQRVRAGYSLVGGSVK